MGGYILYRGVLYRAVIEGGYFNFGASFIPDGDDFTSYSSFFGLSSVFGQTILKKTIILLVQSA